MVVNVRCVVPGDGGAGEKLAEQPRARVSKLVQEQAAARELGMDGKQAGAGRRLEHEVSRCDRRRDAGDEAESDCVENCCSAWLSSERRVCVGSSAANLASRGRNADGAAARPRMADPNLRRKRICAASQES
jgi:hypothetical protein